MSLSFIMKTVHRSMASCVFSTFRVPEGLQPAKSKNFHSICENHRKIGSSFLRVASSPLVNAVCGMKTKGRLNLRCKSCYFVTRQGRRYVMCKTHPRHKQQALAKREENTWILTHFTQGKKRPWGRW